MSTYEIINIVINSFMSVVALVALILGVIYFNKRLKVYVYLDNSEILKIIAFDKGNGACKFEKFRYSIDNKVKNEFQSCNEVNEIMIDTRNLGNYSFLEIEILDNFGRKYKRIYKK